MTDQPTETVTEQFARGEIPQHTYETVAGSEPSAYAEHEPRTILHTVTTGEKTEVFMMTEIGDGAFVQWSICARCGKHITACTDKGGPALPGYMNSWLTDRFRRSLDARPDPDFKLLDKVLSWVRERGYVVRKKGDADPDKDLFVKLFQAAGAIEAPKDSQLDDVLGEFQADYDRLTGHVAGEPLPGGVITEADGETVDAAATFATENNPLVDVDEEYAAAEDARLLRKYDAEAPIETKVASVDVDF